MNIEALERIGLTKGESKVYITLLSLGKTSVGKIIKQAHVSRSKIYDILARLADKGLVGSVMEGRVKVFQAVPPKNLQELLEKKRREIVTKEKELQKILPQLELLQPTEEKTSAEILHGPRGIRTLFEMSLSDNPQKEELLVLGYSKEASLYFHAYFRQHHQRRAELKIPGRVIYDYETWHLKDRQKRKYVEQRFLPKGVKTPVFLYMFADTVGTIVFTREQKICFVIKNKEVAQSYREYFNLLWKQAIKTDK